MEIKISDSIRYIGASVEKLDLFEGQYPVPSGMAYNSYLILDDKVAVMDTADKIVTDQWLANLQRELAGRKPDYLVVQHLEPDHSGSVQTIVDLYPEMQVVCSIRAKRMMPQFVDLDESRIIVKDEGDSLELGSHTLHFVTAPMVHWPEVLLSYESSEKVLFAADAFGKFGAYDADEPWADEARRYYLNIVGKYGQQVQNVLKKAAGLDIKTVCPLHGPILTDTIGEVLRLYDLWSSYTPEEEGVFIAYASIHGNTAGAAHKMKEMLESRGVNVKIADLSRVDVSECVAQAFRYSKMLCMASTYDGGVFAPMSDFLHHLQSKAFQNRQVALIENGSWGPAAARTMKGIFEQMKNITFIGEPITIRTRVKARDIEAMEKLADQLV